MSDENETKVLDGEESVVTSNPQPALEENKKISLEDKMDLLGVLDIPLTIEVGRSQMRLSELLDLKKGSVIELDKMAGEPVEVYANGKKIADGNIITANGKYCVRVNSVLEEGSK